MNARNPQALRHRPHSLITCYPPVTFPHTQHFPTPHLPPSSQRPQVHEKQPFPTNAHIQNRPLIPERPGRPLSPIPLCDSARKAMERAKYPYSSCKRPLFAGTGSTIRNRAQSKPRAHDTRSGNAKNAFTKQPHSDPYRSAHHLGPTHPQPIPSTANP